jgi:alpha 1,2-mannosyltransferase
LYPSRQDNIPLRDPTHLFDSKRYNAPGSGRAAFWPDLSKDHVDNAIWRFVGDPCTLEHWTFESGQIVIDKVGRSTAWANACGLITERRKALTWNDTCYTERQTGNDGLNLAALYIAAYMQEKEHQEFFFKMCGVSSPIQCRVIGFIGMPTSSFSEYRVTRTPM